METGQYEYFAFISYKREDEKWAIWLQKKLESYSLPTAIRKKKPELPNKIRPVFRDQSELAGGNPAEECFPERLRQLTGEKEILGININEMGRDTAAIKVVAIILDLNELPLNKEIKSCYGTVSVCNISNDGTIVSYGFDEQPYYYECNIQSL